MQTDVPMILLIWSIGMTEDLMMGFRRPGIPAPRSMKIILL